MNFPRFLVWVAVSAAALSSYALHIQASAEDVEETPSAQLQVGPWIPVSFNIEEPFINVFSAGGVSWTEHDDVNTQALYGSGVIDAQTGLPRSLPWGWMRSGVYFTGKDKSHWAGDWVLEWETEGDAPADLKLHWFPDGQQRRVAPNRVEFKRFSKFGHAAIAIERLDAPLTAVRIFRKENEAALRAGKIYNPAFVDALRNYDVVRTMDLQEANRAAIRSVDDIATMEACCWNNTIWQSRTNDPFRSMPLEAVFALGVEADVAIWHHGPLTLGAPQSLHGLTREDVQAAAKTNANAILQSTAWDEYADKLVSALIGSGYPEDRPLYTTLGNEVWNYAGQYLLTTHHAAGVGEAATGDEYAYREGYGQLMARYAMALEGALERAGRMQNVVYVFEGQAANPWTTSRALKAAKAHIEAAGGDWARYAEKSGVSVASYWSNGWKAWPSQKAFQEEIKNDPDGAAKKWADYIVHGPAHQIATKAWILKQFAAHALAGEGYGVKLIGAYEGGSHDSKPEFAPAEWFERYHWGPEGARANKAVNDALVAAYPGIILSNYVLAGPPDPQNPWFDGGYGQNTAMQDSWRAYQRH